MSELKIKAARMLLEEHKCPDCGGYELEFFFPNLVDGAVETDVECQNCNFSVILKAAISHFFIGKRGY